MSIKSFLREFQDMKGGLGTGSRRSLDVRFSCHHRSGSLSSVFVEAVQMSVPEETDQQSCWASLPPELLRDVLQRVEASESTWPGRKHVVACACVCRYWRHIVKELVKTPEQCGKLTFPVSLKQPGPRDDLIQCFIKRDRTNFTYHLYLGLSSRLVENGKFLLAARKIRRATSSDYIISLNRDDMSKDPTSWEPSSPYTTARLLIAELLHRPIKQVGGSGLSKSLLVFLQEAMLWLISRMN